MLPSFPHEMLKVVKSAFTALFQPSAWYRTTGVVLSKLEVDTMTQLDLFSETFRALKCPRVYEAVDRLRAKYGKHTLFLGSSLPAQRFARHQGEREDLPQRTHLLLKGETTWKRLGIPMLMGDVR